MQWIVRFFIVSGVFVLSGAGLGLLLNALHPHGASLYAAPVPLPTTCTRVTETLFETEQLSASTLAEQLLFSAPVVVADTRSADAYQQEHIKGAVHLPCQGPLGQRFLRTLAANTHLVLYDAQGTSLALTEALRAAKQTGLMKVHVLQGGFAAWQQYKGACQSGGCSQCERTSPLSSPAVSNTPPL